MKRFGICLFLVAVLVCVCFAAQAETNGLAAVRLSEIVVSCSDKVLQDASGNSPDWIEIHNTGSEPVSLEGLCLSDGTKKLDKFVFPDVIIPADGYAVVLCSGEDRITAEEMHTSFKLSSDGETIVLSWRGRVLDQVKTGRQAQDVALARGSDGKWEQTHRPTPGAANIIAELFETDNAAAPALRGGPQLNEVMASASPYRDLPGYDYVELYNPGNAVNLARWSIVLTGKEEKTFRFPEGTRVGRDGYLVVYFSDSTSALLTTGFSIPASYGSLTLKNDKGETVDVLSWKEPLYGNLPYGRPAGSSEICYLEKETRGSRNPAKGYPKRADAPKVSVEPGLYDGPVNVELTADAGQTIYYTTDGSMPDRDSKVYSKPIRITETTVLLAKAAGADAMLSEAAAATYFIGLGAKVPVVSVQIDRDYLYDPVIGIMAPDNFQKDWEYPAHVEYFTQEGERILSQLGGVVVSGEVSRQYTQKSLAFFARKAYGAGEFSFNPFPHRDYESVQAFVLRNGGSEGLYTGVRFRDLLLTRLAIDSHAPVSDGRPVLVFVNGELWGHCNIRERVNKDYFAAREGVTDEDVTDRIDILNAYGLASNGSPEEYLALSRYMRKHDLNTPEALAYVLSQIDVDSLFDYVAYSAICGNKDLSNTRFYRIPGGKWTWTLYDLDTAMGDLGAAPMSYFLLPVTDDSLDAFDHVPFSALMNVPQMRERFLVRMGEILETHFTVPALTAAVDSLYADMEPIMRFHVTRWSALTMKSWNENVDVLRKQLSERPAQVVRDAQRLFGLSGEEMQKYFGGFLKKNGK